MSFTSFVDGTRWSDVHAAAACAFLAGTAMFTADFALVLHLQSTGLGGAAVATLIICGTLPMVLLAPITGRMADRFDSRTLMAASGLLQAAAITGMTLTDDLPVLLGLVILNACGTALLNPTVSALIPVIATADDLPRAVATVQTGTLIGMAAGPGMAGFVVGVHGTDGALVVALCCALLRAALCADIRTRRGGIRRDLAAHRDAADRPAWNLRGDRLLTTMVIGVAAVIACLCSVNVLEVFLVREVYGASSSTYGLIHACWTIGMAGGAWIAAAVIRRLMRDAHLAWMLMICLATTGAVCVVLGMPLPTVALLVPIMLCGGVLNACENSAMQIAVARRVPESFRGRAGAKINGTVNGATLIGFVLGGALSSALPTQTAFVVIGVATIAIVACCVPMVRRGTRDEPETVEPEPEPRPAPLVAA
ncbi:MFS transporter [Glycomyces arizonensis]|uniref:MFS transporter n=1 Tax=Glycomyces arizonensis TaxID=256035 RepID=UPI00041D507F|nr:MFS transporter [Glycomyces arizonensis]